MTTDHLPFFKSLNDLGIMYKTDKSSVSHDYLDYYEVFVSPFVEKNSLY